MSSRASPKSPKAKSSDFDPSNIDMSRISAERTTRQGESKPYTYLELKEIARYLGISYTKMTKSELADAITAELKKTKSSSPKAKKSVSAKSPKAKASVKSPRASASTKSSKAGAKLLSEESRLKLMKTESDEDFWENRNYYFEVYIIDNNCNFKTKSFDCKLMDSFVKEYVKRFLKRSDDSHFVNEEALRLIRDSYDFPYLSDEEILKFSPIFEHANDLSLKTCLEYGVKQFGIEEGRDDNEWIMNNSILFEAMRFLAVIYQHFPRKFKKDVFKEPLKGMNSVLMNYENLFEGEE